MTKSPHASKNDQSSYSTEMIHGDADEQLHL